MEHKVFPSFLKSVDEAEGIVETIFAVFGNRDEGNDILMPGSFKKTITEGGSKVKVLDQHNTDSIMRSIGIPIELKEIGRDELPKETKVKFPDATGGVYAKVQFLMDTNEGRGAFIRIKEGAIDEWSFGYDVAQRSYAKIDKRQVRKIEQLKLFELSPVLWGMNPATSTIDAKSAHDEVIKSVTKFQDLELADRADTWSGPNAESNVREWAGGGDDLSDTDWKEYRKAFFWYDGDDSEKVSAYKLGYADIIGGKLVAIPRGIFAVAAALQGARGGVDIPDSDAEKIKTQVAKYYEKMADEFDDDSLIAPWDKSDKGSSLQKKHDGEKLLGNVLAGKLYMTANSVLDGLLSYGAIDFQEHDNLRNAIISSMKGMVKDFSDLGDIDVSYYMHDSAYGYYANNPLDQTKGGRVLSTANAQKIQAALANLHEVLMTAGLIDEVSAAHEDDEDDEDEDEDEDEDNSKENVEALLLQAKLIDLEVAEIM